MSYFFLGAAPPLHHSHCAFPVFLQFLPQLPRRRVAPVLRQALPALPDPTRVTLVLHQALLVAAALQLAGIRLDVGLAAARCVVCLALVNARMVNAASIVGLLLTIGIVIDVSLGIHARPAS